MYCGKVRTLLEGYVAECLNADVRRRVESHVAECQGCSETLVRVRRLDKLLDSIESPEVSPRFAAKVVDLALSGSTSPINVPVSRNQPPLWLRPLNLGFVARSAIVAAIIWLAAFNGIKVGHAIATSFTPPETARSEMWGGLARPPLDRGLAALMAGASGDGKNVSEREDTR